MQNPTNFGDTENAALHPVSLRFKDRALEQLYLRDVDQRYLRAVRAQFIIGTFAYFTFFVLDFTMLGAQAWHVFTARAIVCSLLLGVVLLTFFSVFKKRLQLVMGVGLSIAALGILYIVSIPEPPASYYYYAGILVIIMYGNNFQGLHYYISGGIGLTLAVSYVFIGSLINPIPAVILTNNIFFILCALSWTIWSNYRQEIYLRGEFAHHYFLLLEQQRTQDLLVAAQAGDRAKSEFLAVMSHELRTPLNAIIGFAEIMQKELFGPLGTARYASYVDDIADSGHYLLRVINDILDLSKAEAGRLEIREDEVDLSLLINQSLRMFREKTAESGLTLEFVPSDGLPLLWVDSRLLRQVVINLVSNAVKFTPPGGKISISVSMLPDGGCQLEITDTGIGIEEGDIPRVLQPFVQVENALNRKTGGTGLGLPLVKRIVELHGGTFQLLSAPGDGTTARALFPKERIVPARRGSQDVTLSSSTAIH